MKKLLVPLALIAALATLSACGDKDDDAKPAKPSPTATPNSEETPATPDKTEETPAPSDDDTAAPDTSGLTDAEKSMVSAMAVDKSLKTSPAKQTAIALASAKYSGGDENKMTVIFDDKAYSAYIDKDPSNDEDVFKSTEGKKFKDALAKEGVTVKEFNSWLIEIVSAMPAASATPEDGAIDPTN